MLLLMSVAMTRLENGAWHKTNSLHVMCALGNLPADILYFVVYAVRFFPRFLCTAACIKSCCPDSFPPTRLLSCKLRAADNISTVFIFLGCDVSDWRVEIVLAVFPDNRFMPCPEFVRFGINPPGYETER